jgi:hypothetical protein
VLPALTIPRQLALPRRALSALFAFALAAAAIAVQAVAAPSAPPPGLADTLEPATWAMNVPSSWLAAPAPPLHRGDAIDILALRVGDKAYAVPVAYGLTVMDASERGVHRQVDDDDASALAGARSGGLQLLALLRSTR